MFEGVETGCEERFDSPYRSQPPVRAYVLATVPRTGSTCVSHFLWRSGCLGAPLEYLNFLPGSPCAFAHGQSDKQPALWRSVLHRRTSPNDVFGLECFSSQMRGLQQDNLSSLLEVFATFFPKGDRAQIIRLRPRNHVAHAISYARAALSNVWRKEQEIPAATVEYSDRAVNEARALLDRQAADWNLPFEEVAVEPLTIWYEDVVAQPDAAVQRIASFLGMSVDPAATIVIPGVERQSQEDARLWAERYAEPSRR